MKWMFTPLSGSMAAVAMAASAGIGGKGKRRKRTVCLGVACLLWMYVVPNGLEEEGGGEKGEDGG